MTLNAIFVLLDEDCSHLKKLQDFWIPSRRYVHSRSSKIMELVSGVKRL
jgi:hypothetical protein